MTLILLAVSSSLFSWNMLGRGSSLAAFLLPRPEKGLFWPSPRWTHPARVAVVALETTDLVSISTNAATRRATWRHLSSSPIAVWRSPNPAKIGCSPDPCSSLVGTSCFATRVEYKMELEKAKCTRMRRITPRHHSWREAVAHSYCIGFLAAPSACIRMERS